MNENELVALNDIQGKIYTLRGLQVMLDSDLAEMYEVETKALNQAVRRNTERFPVQFCFQLSDEEFGNLKSQFVTSSWGGRRTKPYVFSEQGVAMLSAVLHSDKAVQTSIRIIDAFVSMRRFLSANAQVFERIAAVERNQLEFKTDTDQKFDRVFKAIEARDIQPKQGIFFEGEIFDAYIFAADLIRSAKKSIVLIDNYVDDTVLTLFAKRKNSVAVKILTKKISRQLALDVEKFNAQYPQLEALEFASAHDRFMIIDSVDVYHIGASLKDLGKKWFAFSKMNIDVGEMLGKLSKI